MKRLSFFGCDLAILPFFRWSSLWFYGYKSLTGQEKWFRLSRIGLIVVDCLFSDKDTDLRSCCKRDRCTIVGLTFPENCAHRLCLIVIFWDRWTILGLKESVSGRARHLSSRFAWTTTKPCLRGRVRALFLSAFCNRNPICMNCSQNGRGNWYTGEIRAAPRRRMSGHRCCP